MDDIEDYIQDFEQALLSVNRLSAKNALIASVSRFGKETAPEKMITSALERIGKKWETGNAALSQVYMSGIICEELIQVVFPENKPHPIQYLPAAAVTFEDYHKLGKQIVLSILKVNGLYVLDYGQGLHAEELVQRARKDGVFILLISTLMFPSALHIKKVRDLITQSGSDIKLVVGGAPFLFDNELWKQVGADAMGRTASDAVKLLRKLLEGRS